MAKQNKEGLSTESYKGVRDFYPEDMAVQNYIFDVWRKVSEQFGYQEYTASILEPAELYRQKSGDEIVNDQMYIFTDKGDREVALRPEMTPTLARMVAGKRKSLKFPLRWYSIPNLFRYERPQRGRKREHWQLNCDLLGTIDNDPVNAEVEIISIAHKIMKEFGAKDEDFLIRVGNRTLIESKLEKIGLARENYKSFFQLKDRKGKISKEEYENGMKSIGISIEKLSNEIENLNDDSKLIDSLGKAEIKNVTFDTNIVRGFDYYTGMVFEVFDTNPENKRSLFGGGRYDNLLEMFGVEPVPTVGFGMGDVTIKDFLTTHNLPLTSNR
ncbi:MAG: ATP phosphoribosyltransferase regulatory subunit [bacterium]|nr:ATP phosphoribosyltransferase regulatory subunit [bacterium]